MAFYGAACAAACVLRGYAATASFASSAWSL